jgi:hypothetical protein
METFPRIDRARLFSMRMLRELLVELALGVPALLLVARWRSGRGGAATVERSAG